MKKPPRHRRTASLPLPSNVLIAYQKMCDSFKLLHSISLLNDVSNDVKLRLFCNTACQFYTRVISFSFALQCSVNDVTQPPSTEV